MLFIMLRVVSYPGNYEYVECNCGKFTYLSMDFDRQWWTEMSCDALDYACWVLSISVDIIRAYRQGTVII